MQWAQNSPGAHNNQTTEVEESCCSSTVEQICVLLWCAAQIWVFLFATRYFEQSVVGCTSFGAIAADPDCFQHAASPAYARAWDLILEHERRGLATRDGLSVQVQRIYDMGTAAGASKWNAAM